MENTLENKANFFAQYWRQKVLTGESETIHTLNAGDMAFGIQNNWLQLKPISSITDEDSLHIYLYIGSGLLKANISKIDYIKDLLNGKVKDGKINWRNYIYMTDVLRSKGYALPYMGLGVEKQIEYGWIKLIE